MDSCFVHFVTKTRTEKRMRAIGIPEVARSTHS